MDSATRVFQEATRRNMLSKWTHRKRPAHVPSDRAAATTALRESGIPEKDITILVEGNEREIRAAAEWGETVARFRTPEISPAVDRALTTLQETVGDGQQDTGQLSMPPMPGWQAEGDGGSTYVHSQHGRVKLGAGRWTRHHASTGRILASGTTQESLASHLSSLKGEVGGSSESLDDVLHRIRYGGPATPPGLHVRLAEALTKTVQSVPSSSSGEDLHSRLRKALVRP